MGEGAKNGVGNTPENFYSKNSINFEKNRMRIFCLEASSTLELPEINGI